MPGKVINLLDGRKQQSGNCSSFRFWQDKYCCLSVGFLAVGDVCVATDLLAITVTAARCGGALDHSSGRRPPPSQTDLDPLFRLTEHKGGKAIKSMEGRTFQSIRNNWSGLLSAIMARHILSAPPAPHLRNPPTAHSLQ